jgi:hypothetical protein
VHAFEREICEIPRDRHPAGVTGLDMQFLPRCEGIARKTGCEFYKIKSDIACVTYTAARCACKFAATMIHGDRCALKIVLCYMIFLLHS